MQHFMYRYLKTTRPLLCKLYPKCFQWSSNLEKFRAVSYFIYWFLLNQRPFEIFFNVKLFFSVFFSFFCFEKLLLLLLLHSCQQSTGNPMRPWLSLLTNQNLNPELLDQSVPPLPSWTLYAFVENNGDEKEVGEHDLTYYEQNLKQLSCLQTFLPESHQIDFHLQYCTQWQKSHTAYNGLVAKWTNNTNDGSVPLDVPGTIRVRQHTQQQDLPQS